MSTIGQPERTAQNRVIALFRDELGYRYLSDWTDRPDNSNIEEGLLTAYLTKCGYSPAQISKALYELRTEAGNPNRSLYDNNKKVYSLLRYGVPVKKIEAGKVTPPVAPPVTPPLEVLVRLLGQAGALRNAEMRKHLGLTDRTHLRERYLDPALSRLPVLSGPRGVSPVCGQQEPRPGCTGRTRLV